MRRLLYFPEGYPDEDFRSIIYRYHLWSGNPEIKESKEELFNVASERIGHVPRNLATLINKSPYGTKILVEAILKHTWYPLFKPFISKERLSVVNDDIMNGASAKSNFVGKLMTQRILPILANEIKYCPICIKEDEKQFGQCYVHLTHQLVFMDICVKHNIKLWDKCPNCKKKYANQRQVVYTVMSCCAIRNEKIEETDEIIFKKMLLSEFIYFKNNVNIMNNDTLYHKIWILLGRNGYINKSGLINRSSLIEDFKRYYKIEILKAVGFEIDLVFNQNNLPRLLQQENMVRHILFYILLIIFLAGSIRNFIEDTEGYSNILPFGSGPWPCYNPICTGFKCKPIVKCERKKDGNKFIGWFKCPLCGFIYTRKWKNDDDNSNQNYSVKSMGQLWINRVIELYTNGYNYSEIAKVVSSHKGTVRNQLIKLNKFNEGNVNDLLHSMHTAYSEVAATKNSQNDDVRKMYRRTVLKIISENKMVKRTDLSKEVKKEYRWLLKNDSIWLDKVIPPLKQRSLDYISLDNILRDRVRVVAKVVYQSNPSTRITKYTILNTLDYKEKNQFLSHKNKLPNTNYELEKHIESVADYQVRHIPSLVSQLKSSGYVNVTLNSILSFRKSYRNCTEETKKRIEKVLYELQNEN